MEQSSKPTSKFYGLFQYVFDHYNDALFCGTIKDCLIVVTRRKNVFGHNTRKRWFSIQDQETDELALNPSMFIKFPLIEICQTIVHEMRHGWQYHYGKPSQEGCHNKEWANKMIDIGLMPSRTGKPGGKNSRAEYGRLSYCQGSVPRGFQGTHEQLNLCGALSGGQPRNRQPPQR